MKIVVDKLADNCVSCCCFRAIEYTTGVIHRTKHVWYSCRYAGTFKDSQLLEIGIRRSSNCPFVSLQDAWLCKGDENE